MVGSASRQGCVVFERFSGPARLVMVLAHEEAQELGHTETGTGHLLLGLVREPDGSAARALGALGLAEDQVRRQITPTTDPGPARPGAAEVYRPFTPAAKRAFTSALRASAQRDDDYIGTGHLLLGIIDAGGDSTAVGILIALGTDLELAHELVDRCLREEGVRPEEHEVPVDGTARASAPPARWARSKRPFGIGGPEGVAAIGALERAQTRALRDEVARLRAVLRRHGIDPDEPAPSG